MSKSQTAVPAIILTVMALLIWYLLWIPPQQRYELLFGPQPIDSDSGQATDYSYFTASVGEIGAGQGTLLYTANTTNLRISYPSIKSLLNSYNYESLSATLFFSANKIIQINEDYETLELELNAGAVQGTPKISVSVNGSTVYENELLSNSKTVIKLPFSATSSAGKAIEVACKFNSNSLFSSQKCNFDSINLYNYEYIIEKESDSKTFFLNPQAKLAELLELNFNVDKSTEYSAALSINGQKVFQGALSNSTSKLSIDLEGVTLNEHSNNLSMQAERGAEYELSDVSLDFYSLPFGISERYFVFDLIPNAFGALRLKLFLNVTGIVESGDLRVDVFSPMAPNATFIISENNLMLGINEMHIPIGFFSEKANNLKISSPNGRIIISDIKLYE